MASQLIRQWSKMSDDQDNRAQTVDGEDWSAGTSPKAVSSRENFTTELKEFIARSPGIFGAADILNFDYLHPLERAGILAGILTGIVTADHHVAVRSILIVAPPETDLSTAHSCSWRAMIATLQLLDGRELPANAEAWLKTRFNVISAPDLATKSLLGVMAKQPERGAVVVTDAAKYRGTNIAPYVDPDALTPRIPEDIWVPQVHALATAATEVACERNLYVALDTGQMSPRRPALQDLLTSIPGCGVMGSSNDQDLLTVIGDRIGDWDRQVREGHLDQVLREIEELPPLFDSNKTFLCIQMLHRAGQWNEALQAIREELTLGRQIEGPARVKLARIVQVAGDSKLASEVLSPAVDQLDSFEDLEGALATAHDAGYEELEERVASRLGMLFPDSPGVRARKLRIMETAGDYSGIVEMLTSQENNPDSLDLFHELARFLSGLGTPDYLALAASATGDHSRSEAFRMACVHDALQRGWIRDAFKLALPLPETPSQSGRGEQLLVKVLEAIFLRARNGKWPISEERISGALLSLIERLAADQTNHRLRVGLVSLLQLSVSGHTGLALIASVVLKFALMPTTIVKRKVAPGPEMEWLTEHRAFLSDALAWLKGQKSVVLGDVILPESLLTEPADDIVSALTKYLNYAQISDQDDVVLLSNLLALATSVTPYSSDPNNDIDLVRLVAAKLVSSGHAQVGRDLAEYALQNGTAIPIRRRLGWFAMADVYHRCHNYVQASVALACALAVITAVDEEQAWYEANMLARLFRDCHLYEFARISIDQSRQRLAGMGLTEAYSHRLDTLQLQIRQLELDWTGDNREELEALIDDAVQNGEATLKLNDEAAPAAFLVGQMISIAKKCGADVPSKADAVFADLCERSGGNVASLAKAFSSDSISVTKLFDLVKARDLARYSDDVGYDMRNVAIVAAKALASDDYIQSAVGTSFALELMADRGVAVPGWSEAASPPAAPKRIEEPAEMACSVSGQGLSVVQVGFDSNGQLVRLSAVGGQLELPVREPDEIMEEKRFKNWALKYPLPVRHRRDIAEPLLYDNGRLKVVRTTAWPRPYSG